MLVDVDLTGSLPDKFIVEGTDFVSITYERLPSVCSHCGIVGHLISNCKFAKKYSEDQGANVRDRSEIA